MHTHTSHFTAKTLLLVVWTGIAYIGRWHWLHAYTHTTSRAIWGIHILAFLTRFLVSGTVTCSEGVNNPLSCIKKYLVISDPVLVEYAPNVLGLPTSFKGMHMQPLELRRVK